MKLWAYLKERFPPVNMMLFVILYLAVYKVAQGPLQPDFWFVPGMVATISFFFRLRVMDEIKDFDHDAIHYPQRVLQSGGVTLRFLIGLSCFLALSELIWSYRQGMQGLLFWLIAVGYALLMRYEFFIGSFLKQRLVWYALSHMMVMPLVILWLWFAWRDEVSAVLGLLMLLSLLGGFVFELARKTHAPSAEREGIASYSRILGVGGVSALILVLLWLSVACQLLLFRTMELAWWSYALALVCAIWVSWSYQMALRERKNELFRKAEKASSVYMLASYVVLILAA